MHELLHHLIGVLLALPTWVGPLLFLPIARAQLERGGSRTLWRAWLVAVVAFAAFATVGWYISPDTAGSPLGAVAGELILIAPSLAVTAVVLQETRGSSLTERNRLAIAGLTGMAVLLVCFMPAAGVSAALGGSEVGSDPC
jgi:hypothetical protein